MADIETLGDFPRDDFRELLHDVQQMFASAQDRKNLLASLGLSGEVTESQRPVAVMPGIDGTDKEKTAGLEVDQLPSAARFAAELVDIIARRSNLDAAMTLARRAIRESGGDTTGRWAPLIEALGDLQKRHRPEAESSPDLDGFKGWIGFDCKHPYSLSDRFLGRKQYLERLDRWSVGKDEATILCLCALGGGGKSALAWHWLSDGLTALRQQAYQGAFWCSFYEKNFNFDEFLRRALAFAGRIEERALPQSRSAVEDRLLEVLSTGRFVFVLDGLERLMNGYAAIADRAVDLEGQAGRAEHGDVPRRERRMADPQDAAFLRRLASARTSRILITTRLAPADLEAGTGTDYLPHVAETKISGFTAGEAADLWKSIAPSAPITDGLQALFRVCGYHPLVISIVARCVVRAGGTWEEWLQLEEHRDFDPRGKTSEAIVRSHIIGVCMRDLPDAAYDVLGVLTATGKPMPLAELTKVLLLGSAASGDSRWTSEAAVTTQIESLLQLGLVGAATPPDQATEYDLHPVVRGAVWCQLIDPNRERFLEHALSELNATPDRQGPDELGSLSKAIALYQLFVRTGQLDRAWEMFVTRLVPPLERDSANRELFDLYRLLLPERDVLRLLPLTSRRAQADATMVLGWLLGRAGEGRHSERLLRWCGAIRLQIGDHRGFLDAAHSRAWQTMYEGRLFETELSLRRTRLEALAYGALDLRPALDCWIGIVLALRGEAALAHACFEKARGRTSSYRWWAQGLAEGLVYLEAADQALEVLSLLEGGVGTETAEGVTQAAWEKLTQGMACFQAGDDQRALDLLSTARTVARKASYAIIQCFAIPYLAEIQLKSSHLAEAEETAASYLELDPHESYRLCAADARRVRAKCRIAAGDHETARAEAARAYDLAACDGPPFVYHAGLRRVLDVLEQCEAYVPPTRATLDPLWREKLAHVEREEQSLERAIAQIVEVPIEEPTFEAAMATIEEQVLQRASDQDRIWWDEMTGSRAAIKVPVAKEMQQSGISLKAFREAFDRSEYKSFSVVFRQLSADRIISPDPPSPVRTLSEAELKSWLAKHDEHDSALDEFLASPLARYVSAPFEVHDFDAEDVTAFLEDRKRRIAVDEDWKSRQWWEQLERHRPPFEMLVLAECVLRMAARLGEVVSEVSAGSRRGVEYGFAALLTRRAIENLKSKTISKTEGWSPVEVLLRLQDVKLQLGWSSAGKEARQFWDRLERENEHHLNRVLQLAEELARRDASIEQYYRAFLASNTENIDANLAYVDYLINKDVPWDGSQPWPTGSASERWAYDTARPAYSDQAGLTPEQISGRLEILLGRLGWSSADAQLKRWWDAHQALMTPENMLRLAEELDARRSTLSQLQTAYIDGRTENVVAALAFRDFTILKGGEARRAQERAAEQNRIGNALYDKRKYREAVQSYEAAINESPAPQHYKNLAGAWELVDDVDRVTAITESVGALRRGLEKFPSSNDLKKALAVADNKRRLVAQGGLPAGASSINMLPVVTPLAMEVAHDLIPYIEAGDRNLLESVQRLVGEMRDRILAETGIKLPGVRFRGNDTDMPPGSYLIMINEIPLVMGTLTMTDWFTMAEESELKRLEIQYRSGTNPLTGEGAFWISAADASRLTAPGWDATEHMFRHLEAVARRNLREFFGAQEAVNRLEDIWSPIAKRIASDSALVERLVRVTRSLLDEDVPVVEMELIGTSLAAHDGVGRSMDDLLTTIRRLPEIRSKLPGNEPGSEPLQLTPRLEATLRKGLRAVGDEFVLALEPETTQEILSAVRTAVRREHAPPDRRQVLVVQDSSLRHYVRKLTELEFPHVFTLAQEELVDELRARTPLVVDIDE